jgi:hypothetical protein
LRNHEALIQFQNLPATLRDAVTVTRSLGLQHIWTGRLCIIQGDDEEMTREIAPMLGIYRGAYVTIAAASAAGSGEGFLHVPRCRTRISVEMRTGIKIFFLTEFLEEHECHFPNPLSTRAWTLQEYILSSRVILFSSRHLIRVCSFEERCSCAVCNGSRILHQ